MSSERRHSRQSQPTVRYGFRSITFHFLAWLPVPSWRQSVLNWLQRLALVSLRALLQTLVSPQVESPLQVV